MAGVEAERAFQGGTPTIPSPLSHLISVTEITRRLAAKSQEDHYLSLHLEFLSAELVPRLQLPVVSVSGDMADFSGTCSLGDDPVTR